tara:strand:- start:244 stop:591 length:348 start_codon:yes stop_codon:yes gene_type:complete
MKSIFKVADKTVHIEEFSYPLDEFLKDEPDFLAPKEGELIYKQGESLSKESGYSSKILDQYIVRKNLYRDAYKARRNGWPKKAPDTKTPDDVAKEKLVPEKTKELQKESKKQKGD